MNFKRTLGVRGVETKCIFSGSKGEVCCVEPLLLNHLNSHPLRGSILVAMATLTKVRTKSRLEFLYFEMGQNLNVLSFS